MLKNHHSFDLIRAYAGMGLVIDTNLLILDFVGSYNLSHIATFKRTLTYTINDYTLLQNVQRYFQKVIVNQPILTEAFNLIDSLNNLESYALNNHLINRIAKLRESLNPNKEILGMRSFSKFGFADASIDLLSTYNLILTDDLRLYHYLSTQSKQVINFNHIRELG